MVGDYLITVEPNKQSGHPIVTHRLTDKTDQYKEGFLAAVELEYSNYNKYRVNCIKL